MLLGHGNVLGKPLGIAKPLSDMLTYGQCQL